MIVALKRSLFQSGCGEWHRPHSARAMRLSVFCSALTVMLAGGVAAAQPEAEPRRQPARTGKMADVPGAPFVGLPQRPPFTQFVPASASIFIEITGLAELESFLRDSDAERLLPLATLPGDSMPQGDAGSGSPLPAFDPNTLIRTFLGPTCRMTIDDLRGLKFGFAARSWSDFADGVFFVHMPDENALGRWFAGSERRSTRISPHARLLRVEGATICTRGLLLAASRTSAGNSVMRESLRLMAGRVTSGLADQESFQRLSAYLPARPLAMGYFEEMDRGDGGEVSSGNQPEADANLRPDAVDAGDAGQQELPAPWRAVVAVYARDGRLEVAVRANRPAARAQSALAPTAIERLRRLPATTVMAWATTAPGLNQASSTDGASRIGVSQGSESTAGGPGAVATGRGPVRTGYAGIRRLLGLDELPVKLGPHLILAWDGPFRGAAAGEVGPDGAAGNGPVRAGDAGAGGEYVPQFAVLIQSADVSGPRPSGDASDDEPDSVPGPSGDPMDDWFGRLARRVVDRLCAMDPAAAEYEPEIRVGTHRGVSISSLVLSEYAAHAALPGARLLGRLEPSWARVDDWWVAALTRGQLERIVDAASGEAPALESVADVRTVLDPSGRRTSVVVMQTAAAAALLGRWLTTLEEGGLFSPGTWEGGTVLDVIQPDRLGIGMRAEEEPGAVVVVRVDPETAADGLLEPGDRIIGIDGRLLDLDSPNTDLRRRWLAASDEPRRVLRVERQGATLDVALRLRAGPGEGVSLPEIPGELLKAVAEIVRVGREIAFASYAEIDTDPQHYAALFTVRLAPPAEKTTETTARRDTESTDETP